MFDYKIKAFEPNIICSVTDLEVFQHMRTYSVLAHIRSIFGHVRTHSDHIQTRSWSDSGQNRAILRPDSDHVQTILRPDSNQTQAVFRPYSHQTHCFGLVLQGIPGNHQKSMHFTTTTFVTNVRYAENYAFPKGFQSLLTYVTLRPITAPSSYFMLRCQERCFFQRFPRLQKTIGKAYHENSENAVSLGFSTFLVKGLHGKIFKYIG